MLIGRDCLRAEPVSDVAANFGGKGLFPDHPIPVETMYDSIVFKTHKNSEVISHEAGRSR